MGTDVARVQYVVFCAIVGKKLECVTAEDEMTLFIGVFYESGA